MITYERVKTIFDIVNEMKGHMTLNYLLFSDIDEPEKCYNLYYAGANKIEISSTAVTIGGEFYYLEGESNLQYVDNVYDVLSKDIREYVFQALENLKLEPENLKYFDNDYEGYKVFFAEVQRLSLADSRELSLDKLIYT